jgi:hypothetical protein
MKKLVPYIFLAFPLILFSGCTTTFAGSILVLSFRDLIWYVALAFIFGILIAFKSNSENRKRNFWIWFLLSLVLTPLVGFIYLLIQFSRSKKE